MDRKGVLKGLNFFGIAFIIVSVMQFIGSIILLNIPMTINGEVTTLTELFGNNQINAFSGLIIWVFIHAIIAYFFGLGCCFLVIRKKDQLENMRLAKYLVIMGIFILIACFIQLKYILMLTSTEVSISGTPNFQEMIYNPEVVPFIADAIWFSYTGVICGYLQVGLIVTAGGLKWIIELKKPEEQEKKRESEEKELPAAVK
ncbi:MAG: hypothetical protein R6U96_17845 [Promethearchaeia archaeon]